MPYTPPSQRSPASSKPTTPNFGRSHSYSHEQSVAPPNSGSRPVLPRSLSSAAYLQKHRRSPSISQSNGAFTSGPAVNQADRVHDNRGTAHNGTECPTSQQASDEEDRSRRWGNLEALHVAVRSIEQRRESSPSGGADDANQDPSTSASKSENADARPALTAEARKISHSRSSSEITLSQHNLGLNGSPLQGSDESEEDEDGLEMKPPLLRKKSGELVKPALRPPTRRRPSSMPGTPTYGKAVHFNEDIEQVRHFLQVDRPIAVSAGSSPVETYDSESEYPFGFDDRYKSRRVEWEIRQVNFPRDTYERQSRPVRVERIFLSADRQTLIGSVAVANLAFHKTVIARFTLDYWKTVSEVAAEYNNDVRKKQSNDGYDRFNFTIKLTDQAYLENKTLLLCVRFNVNGREYWDNNEGMNYQVDFIKKNAARSARIGAQQGLASGSLGPLPRSRKSPPPARPRSMPVSFDDDFSSGFDSRWQFGSGTGIFVGGPLNSTIPLKKKAPSDGAPSVPNQVGQAFSSRYDFSASLTAALSNAQSALGERSGIPQKSGLQSNPGTVSDDASATAPKSEQAPPDSPSVSGPARRPDALSSEKPGRQSAEYNELIQKYCFFGSGKSSHSAPTAFPAGAASSAGTSRPTADTPQTDGACDAPASEPSSGVGSKENSGASSPTGTKDMSCFVDGASDSRSPPTSPRVFLQRSASPGPVTGGSDISSRATSPVSFHYPYHQSMHGGFFSDTHTPTAIRG